MSVDMQPAPVRYRPPVQDYAADSNRVMEGINEDFISREGETDHTVTLTVADAQRLATLAVAYETRTLAMIQYRAQGMGGLDLRIAIDKRLGL